MTPTPDFATARARMVAEQLAARGIRDPRLLAAMQRLPRHAFVPPSQRARAYQDTPLPIGLQQTISQPYIVARMTELLELQGTENVLEIGTGSGYQAAVLAALARRVTSLERQDRLARQSAHTLRALAIQNVEVVHTDGSGGWPANAPYDAILVAAAAPGVPPPLLEQLTEGGRLVLPVGTRGLQRLQVWQRRGADFHHTQHNEVMFVPLRGKHGWDAR